MISSSRSSSSIGALRSKRSKPELRSTIYGSDFASQNDALTLENTIPWDENAELWRHSDSAEEPPL